MKWFIVIACMTAWVVEARAQEFPVMIPVSGGSFTMGCNEGERDEMPAHLTIVGSFWMARTETTVLQWKLFCTSTRRAMPDAPWFGWKDDHPIVNISWDDAVAYCYWLREKTGKTFRLPTEAEWEFAAKGGAKGNGLAYSGNSDPGIVAWYGHKTEGTMPVAQKPANELGLFDMSGNVWEWCDDWYCESYDPADVDRLPAGSPRQFKVLRGGAWDIGARNSRNTYRNPLSPTSRNHNKGFRVAY